jgi:hypothetical protein
MSYLSWHVLSYYRLEPYIDYCHTAIENLSDPIGYLLDFTNPYYTVLAGNMKACAKKDNIAPNWALCWSYLLSAVQAEA